MCLLACVLLANILGLMLSQQPTDTMRLASSVNEDCGYYENVHVSHEGNRASACVTECTWFECPYRNVFSV